MRFDSGDLPTVHLASIGIEIAPEVVSSSAIEDTLAPAWEAMGIAPGQLEQLTGVGERRWWPEGTRISEMAARACRNALEKADLGPERVGQLAYTGVCREYFEPATACAVAAQLDLAPDVALYDVSNACLGAMDQSTGFSMPRSYSMTISRRRETPSSTTSASMSSSARIRRCCFGSTSREASLENP